MKTINLIKNLPLIFLLLLAPLSLSAQKSSGMIAKTIAKYDTDSSGQIDGDEIASIIDDFNADAKGDLSRFDTNKDGKLSPEEVTQIKPGSSGKKDGGKKDGKAKK